mmetsp:Transcript_59137/g.116312  ORF Transcript_59137/g.116312 Transcript_59137/m.116312 type:complete len:311 (-) Transcript_59137:110-1042(-)
MVRFLLRTVKTLSRAKQNPVAYRRAFSDYTTGVDSVIRRRADLSSLWDYRLFPWRETLPGNRMMLSPFFNIFGVDLNEPSQKAFQCAVDGIFNHHLMVKHRDQVSSMNPTTSTPSSQEPPENVPNLTEIFHPDLATFFKYAVEQHCLKSKHICTFELQEINGTQLRDVQFFGGAPRGNRKLDSLSLSFSAGFFQAFVPHEVEMLRGLSSAETVKELLKNQAKYVDLEKFLLRICVDVECIEVFAITDAESGEVVQGELKPKVTSHKIMLENIYSIDPSFAFGGSGWTIVDIDDWLKGNEYWARDRLKPPQ